MRFALVLLLSSIAGGQTPYARRCAACHGADGRGGERAPSIVSRIPALSDPALIKLIRTGLPGMPPMALPGAEMQTLIAHLRTLSPAASNTRSSFVLDDGRTVSGTVISRGESDIHLETEERKLVLLRAVAANRWRVVTSDANWTSYHGEWHGSRHSPLDQINTSNISRLRAQWIFSLQDAQRLQVTPTVADGVMYVTNVNQIYALDAGNGRQIWRFRRPRTPGLAGDSAAGINRGVAIAGDRLFFATDHAHLLALNRHTGQVLWETEIADYRANYGSTSAPLVGGNFVIAGVSGGDEGIRGFLAAYRIEDGKEAWRFWTVPKPGEPLSETWKGKAIEHGCAATWLTGVYDPALDRIFWPTGNPCPDYNGEERQGDNLYSCSMLALDRATGKLSWHFQFTPHDLHDWDASEVPLLFDANFAGKPRKLLAQANRNGFYYLLDRTTGEFLHASPFVEKLTWATGVDRKGRPILTAGTKPTPEGVTVCPAVQGATNWMAPAYNPQTGLVYVQTLEKCNIYRKSPTSEWKAGESYYEGDTRSVPGDQGRKILRALNALTGRIVWEVPQTGSAQSWGGVLSTNGGLVFFGDDSGAFAAVDASTGSRLWSFQCNEVWKASPMTYRFDGRQYIAVASGPNILAFALSE
jgi:alcohol dehydrogenase (cytochrome c)